MLIDYLRYQAFSGRFRRFFEDGIYEYANPEETTGQHLRFSPEWIDSQAFQFKYGVLDRLYEDRYGRDFAISWLLNEFGFVRRPNSKLTPEVRIGEFPPTTTYEDDGFPHMEIIVDIHPRYWNERYFERRSYENTPIIYRLSAPARANFSAGDRLVDKYDKRSGYGTLCGTFKTGDGLEFGLTCGHVTRDRGSVLVERPRRFWKFVLGSTTRSFGSTRFHTMCCSEMKTGRVTTQLDAALIARDEAAQILKRNKSGIDQAILRPISSVLQEDPVHFRGASRNRAILARISAVTVRKSIDLFNDGNLHSVGDVLMLGHRERMYITQPISRPGDSGSAVRFGIREDNPAEQTSQWYGMILGGDENSSYASHAEFIWAWAAGVLSTGDLEFYF